MWRELGTSMAAQLSKDVSVRETVSMVSAEVVGDVLARHGQVDGIAAQAAFRHFQEKARDALLRGLGQEQHALLHTAQLAGGQGKELAGNLRIAAGEGRERAALDHAQPRVGNRFRREKVRARANSSPTTSPGR